jgi:hypothetical protein
LGAALAADGTLLPIEKPHNDADSYWCRKDFYAVNWLLACDPNLVVRFLYGAWPGSSHDSRVLGSSGFVELLRALHPFYALSDNGMPLRAYMVTPFKGQLSAEKRAFNYVISSLRIDIECCIGHIKGRFKRFRYPNKDGESLWFTKLFLACVCVHNWIRIHGTCDRSTRRLGDRLGDWLMDWGID